MKKDDGMEVMTFRLDDKQIAIIDRWVRELGNKLGREVTRSEAVRFILEGWLRAEQKLPEIGVHKKVASYPR
jgi:Arc/MetJ-type ribon-helix-helix transcriptional regulator